MQKIFSTADVRAAEAFDYWQDVTRTNISKNETLPFDAPRWSGEVQAEALADLSWVAWRSSPAIARCSGPDDRLMLSLPGTRAVIECDGRCFEVGRSSICLFDPRKPHVARSLEPAVERMIVRIPRDALAGRIKLANLVNRPIPLVGEAALLAGFVHEITRVGPSCLSPAGTELVREQVLDLTAVALKHHGRMLRGDAVRARRQMWPGGRNTPERLRALHRLGLSEEEIARKMGLHPVVVRAMRRRLGLGLNPGDEHDKSLALSWLALQLSLCRHVDDHLVEQARNILLAGPVKPLQPEVDPDE